MQLCEGFAHGLTAAFNGYWNLVGFNLSSSSTHQSIDGYGSGYMANVNANFCDTPTLAAGEQWLYLAWNESSPFSTLGVTTYIAQFRQSGAIQVSVECTSGLIVIRRGAVGSGTELARSTTTVASGVWHWFWIDCVADPVNGRVRVYMDGNPTAVADTGAGVNTAASGGAGWNQIRWLYYAYLGDMATFTDAEKTALFGGTFPELYIPGVKPTSDDTNTFVSGTFASVDEIPWSTADTANADAVGQQLIMGNTGLTWTPTAVYFAANTWYQERDGVVTSMASRMKSGAADVTSAAVATTTATQYSERQVFYPYDPDGSVAWTWAAITAAKFGVQTT